MHESLGSAACQKLGIICEASGMVLFNEKAIGRSELARGKSQMDLSISMWLEDIGQLGFVPSHLRHEMDERLGEGWFNRKVMGRVTMQLLQNNNLRAKLEYSQRSTHKNWLQTLKTKLMEFPSKMRVKFHYWKWERKNI